VRIAISPKSRAGLFAGVDEVICCAFRLKHGMHLRQRGTSLKVARRRVPADEIVDLVRKLYERVQSYTRSRIDRPRLRSIR
jgi:hypothetical protein